MGDQFPAAKVVLQLDLYSINQEYSRVCGRVIGYQVESPDGFFSVSCMVLTKGTWMVSVSPMEIHVIISGVMLLVHMRIAQITHLVFVLALQHQDLGHKHQLLAALTTVNLEIQLTHFLQCKTLLVTNSGMWSSVKVPVAVVPSLPHGSVY